MPSDDRRRAIGKIISVSADRLIVELHRGNDNFTVVGFDDIHYVARLGSFVMFPAQSDYVVAEVIGLWEKDPTTNKSEHTTSKELDKTSSAKYLELVPVGMLPQGDNEPFRFGVSIFPSLYEDALYILDSELDRVFDVANSTEEITEVDGNATRLNALTIGKSVIFEDYDIKVRIDEFFGGHAAILGNTGSGKSCTVATILQSLFEKEDDFRAHGATFVLFDVNGEYQQALENLPDCIKQSHLKISNVQVGSQEEQETNDSTASEFRLPHWFMSVEEWELLLRASERTQIPVLRSALGLTTIFSSNQEKIIEIKEHIIATCVLECLRGVDGDSSVPKFQRILSVLEKYGSDRLEPSILEKHGCNFRYGNFDKAGEPQGLIDELRGYLSDSVSLPSYSGCPFHFKDLETCLDLAILYEEAHGNRQIRDYCAQMITRFKWLRDRDEFSFLKVKPSDLQKQEKDITQFVDNFLGLTKKENALHKAAQIIIVDLNEVADEVVEIVSAVMARLVFERLRKRDPRNRLPVHLILEEAHRYIAERPSKYAIDSSQIFERIAKEGRKFGLFLLVASQRPSELSKTVLSQCSNFIVHRIQNPDDLSHIKQMTPFISDAVMKRLPSLPKQHALIFGNAVNLPTTYKVRETSPRPKSDDANICELWFKSESTPVNISIPTTKR